MGLAELFTRSTKYTVEDTKTGATDTFTIVDNLRPSWAAGAGYSGAMAIPGVWRSTLLVSETLASLPYDAYRERAGKPPEKVDDPDLLDQPNPPDVRVTTYGGWFMDLLHHGNAVGIYTARDYTGKPRACVPVSAADVVTKRIERGDGAPLPIGSIGYRIGTTWYPAEDVFHVKGPTTPGALRGMGVLENHLVETFGLAREQNKQARAVQDAGVPTGVLKSTDEGLEEDDAADLKKAWLSSQRTRTIAVLNATTDFVPLAWNPSETQLLDARRFSLHEIALIFGLDPSWLGAAQTSRVYSNLETEGLNFLRYSLGGWLTRFEQTLSTALPRGTRVKANLDALLRPDTKTRYEAHAIALAAGFLTADEVRELEDRPPLTAAQRAQLAAARPPSPPADATTEENEK